MGDLVVGGAAIPRVRRRVRPVAWAAVVGVAALMATACVTDLSGEAGEQFLPRAVNDRGAMAGLDTEGSAESLVRVDPGGAKVPLLVDGRPTTGEVKGMNESDEVVATIFRRVERPDPNLPPEERWTSVASPMMWDASGRAIDLRALLPDPRPLVHAAAIDINDDGWVVVRMETEPDLVQSANGRIFLLKGQTGERIDVPADAAGPGANPRPVAINNAGVMVGREELGPYVRSTRWVARNGTYEREQLPELYLPLDINGNGEVLVALVGTPGGPLGMIGNGGGVGVLRRGQSSADRLAGFESPGPGFVDGRINDAGTAVINWRSWFGGAAASMRWKAPDLVAETFADERWSSPLLADVDGRGAAVGTATRVEDGHRVPIRWS
jgi:hypothetical protein